MTDFLQKSWAWLLARLSEPSTWAGIAAAAAAVGAGLQSKTGLGAAIIAGAIAFIKAEKSS